MDTNHRFSRITNGWISPKFKVIYSFSPKNNDPALETVFDAPKGIVDRFAGNPESLPSQADRMKLVAAIAKKFDFLMEKRRVYMDGGLQKIANWKRA